MRQVPNPAFGAKYNRVHRHKMDPKEWISVAESHEEHLVNAYPSLQEDLNRLKDVPAPAVFQTIPGKVTGMRLVQLGVPGICRHCGMFEENKNPNCREHPKIGGSNWWIPHIKSGANWP